MNSRRRGSLTDMATFVLIHGAGSDAWYWHLVAPRLQALGHDVVAPDLPCDDDAAGLDEYTDVVVGAVDGRSNLVVVGQSLGGFTAPLVCDRLAVRQLILVAAMVPAPGESGGDWWTNTGQEQARREQDVREGRDPDAEFDPFITFLHDVPTDIISASAAHVREQSGTPFIKPWPLAAWPDVPTNFLLCRQDRFFPADFMRRVVKERLGITPDEMDSGHLPALAHPEELADRLEAYRNAVGTPDRSA
jgi:pimeloyl-ACP methyl ester carboxylesterase